MISRDLGPGLVYFNMDDKEWRTQVVDGRCVFFTRGLGCVIHDRYCYPKVCKVFPHEDGRDFELPQVHDANLCPEVMK